MTLIFRLDFLMGMHINNAGPQHFSHPQDLDYRMTSLDAQVEICPDYYYFTYKVWHHPIWSYHLEILNLLHQHYPSLPPPQPRDLSIHPFYYFSLLILMINVGILDIVSSSYLLWYDLDIFLDIYAMIHRLERFDLYPCLFDLERLIHRCMKFVTRRCYQKNPCVKGSRLPYVFGFVIISLKGLDSPEILTLEKKKRNSRRRLLLKRTKLFTFQACF